MHLRVGLLCVTIHKIFLTTIKYNNDQIGFLFNDYIKRLFSRNNYFEKL